MINSQSTSRHNHYVPEWYQKGFSSDGAFNFFLDLCPPHRRPDGSAVPSVRRRRAPKSCFWELDLYVTRFGEHFNDEVETVLFAGIDDFGANAIRAFIGGDHAQMHDHYQAFFSYLGAQKLRTPKGLDWIRGRYPALDQVELMIELQHLRYLYGTMWAECVREIVSAEDSEVKFIVTDHPVTTFNPTWPLERVSRLDPNDAPVAFNGTQTIFALDANHCLILTHLAYAKDPDGIALTSKRENARNFASTLIRTDALIRSRRLNSDGVIAINQLLKARARRYIAAAEVDWLFPERFAPLDRERVAQVLLPPKNELWHFGGEIYIGYNDGHVDYRDAYGRTSRAHEFIAKSPPESEPADGDPCPCGGGTCFAECCKPLPASERPSWTVMSLRERNLALIRAVVGILGLDTGKSWDDVRRDLSDEQVSLIHNFFRLMWPEGTDLAELLPRPDEKLLRAVYMGLSDPRTVAPSVTSLVPLFDQLLVLNPFLNPANMRPEYSPVDSPSAHKRQLLKNVMFLLTLAPLIQAGKVLLFPDPGDMAPGFQCAMRTMAEERTAQWRLQKPHMIEFEWLQREDDERSLSELPDDVLRSMAKRATPDADERALDLFVKGMRKQQQQDPLALLQALPVGEKGAQFAVMRCVNLELALFVAQLTGAAIVTDIKALWEHLHLHTRAATLSTAIDRSAQQGRVLFRANAHPIDALTVSDTSQAASARAALREVYAAAAGHELGSRAEELIDQLQERLRQVPALAGADATSPEAIDDISFDLSIPEKGFESPTVQRLVVGFGREDAPTSVPLALFRSAAASPGAERSKQAEDP